jgi:hypothetical protein
MPRSAPALLKRKQINKRFHSRTQTALQVSNKDLKKNFHAFLRQLAYPAHAGPSNPLITFLDINKAQPESSMAYIPSIENMISQRNIEEEEINSKSSIEHGFSEEIASEQTFELRVAYMCLLERIMRQLQHHPSISQRRKIIRGTWNILIKYVKDSNYLIFNRIGTKIEWGLLELLNFNFDPSPREKYQA